MNASWQATVDRAAGWRAALVIVAAVACAYASSTRGVFLFDDRLMLDAYLASQPSPDPMETWLAFGGKDSPAAGRPLVAGSFLLNLALEPLSRPVRGPAPLGFRLVNLGLHAAAACTLYVLLAGALGRLAGGRSRRAVAFTAALLWALHPVHTAAVTYVSQRAEVLAALGMLAALLGLEGSASATEEGTGRARWGALAVAAAWLSALAKESALVLPLLLLLYDRCLLAPTWREVWRRRAPLHVGCMATWVLSAALLLSDPRPASVALSDRGLNPLVYALTQANAFWRYLRFAAWPDALPFDFGWPVVALRGLDDLPTQLVGIAPALCGLAAVLGATLWLLARRPQVGFLPAAFFLLLAPTSTFVPITTEIMALHRLYLPLAALVVGAVLAAEALWKGLAARPGWAATGTGWSRGLAAALCGGLAVPLLVSTHVQNRLFRSELTFWQRNVELTPSNPRAWANLGEALRAVGRDEEALVAAERAIEASRTIRVPEHPALVLALSNAASLHRRQGRPARADELLAEAIGELRRDLADHPRSPELHVSLGILLARAGRVPEAIEIQREALRRFGDLPAARWNLAGFLLMDGRIEEARAEVADLLGRDPADPEVSQRLEGVARAVGRLDLVYRMRLRGT